MQDAWFRWIIDLGLPGPDRGEGGKYLIVPPDYKGHLPDGGYFVGHARTNTILWFGRSFLEDHKNPKPVAETIRKFTKVYPYEPGGVGTPISDFLAGKAKLGRVTAPPPTVFHEGSGKVMNTLPPNDWTFYEMLNEVVQKEPATSLDAELMGPVAAIGIVKGKPFAPDARMKKIMTEALALANATSRALFMVPQRPELVLLSELVMVQLLVRERLRVRDSDPRSHVKESSHSPLRATGPWMRAPTSSTASPASRLRWRCACPASGRNICWQ
ncbi:DUF1254 domain-containing protein [Bradyrhizobium elkanii]|uniref:DUF1254 domain-containing protein n=1 Tax=Bradyrhizobium elkanii TaxID=29448 RepID=UPI0035139197